MSDFNFKDKSAPKLSDEFKQKFSVNIKGKDAIKLEGLTAFAHEKGMWKFETEIIQFPSDQNGWTAICKTTVGGYDWDPVNDKVREVIYSDIGDANVTNCGKMVAASYIRMASTRSQARALRKYTNIDMVCSSELSDVVDEAPEPIISVEQLTEVKQLIGTKGISKDKFGEILFGLFQHTNYTSLTQHQGYELISVLKNFVQS
jgi:hypothetical protein